MPIYEHFSVDTDIKNSWIENRNGFRPIKKLAVWSAIDTDVVHIQGVGQKDTVLRGLVGISISEMEEMCKTWLAWKEKIEKEIAWVVEHYTLCDGWVNTWSVVDDDIEVPEVFATKEAAQKELDEFLMQVNSDPERTEDEMYDAGDFRIRTVLRADCDVDTLRLAGIQPKRVTYDG